MSTKGYKHYLTATVEPEVVKQLDELRGQVPRSRIVENALLQYLERESSDKKYASITPVDHRLKIQ